MPRLPADTVIRFQSVGLTHSKVTADQTGTSIEYRPQGLRVPTAKIQAGIPDAGVPASSFPLSGFSGRARTPAPE